MTDEPQTVRASSAATRAEIAAARHAEKPAPPPPAPPPAAPPEKPDPFKNGIIVALTFIGIFVAVVTFLQNYASLQSERLVQQSEFTAVDATGKYFRIGLEVAQGLGLKQNYEDYIQRAVRADTKARALRLGGNPALSVEYDQDARRWEEAAATLQAQMNDQFPLLSEFGDSCIELRLRVWIDDLDNFTSIMSELRFGVKRALSERGIEMPFPQMDVHLSQSPPGNL